MYVPLRYSDLVVVPLAERTGVARVLAVDAVDRARLLVLAVAGDAFTDLDLVALVDRELLVGARVREADEDAGVVRGLGRLPLQAQREVVVGLGVEPEQAEPALALQATALGAVIDEVEAAGAGLGGVGEVDAVPEPGEAGFDGAAGRAGRDARGLDPDVVELGRDRVGGAAAQGHRAEVRAAQVGDVALAADLGPGGAVGRPLSCGARAVRPHPEVEARRGRGDGDVERRVELVRVVEHAHELDLRGVRSRAHEHDLGPVRVLLVEEQAGLLTLLGRREVDLGLGLPGARRDGLADQVRRGAVDLVGAGVDLQRAARDAVARGRLAHDLRPAALLDRVARELVALRVEREGVVGDDRAVGGVVGGVDADLDAGADLGRAADRLPRGAVEVLAADRLAVGDDADLDHLGEARRQRRREVLVGEPAHLVLGEDVLEAGVARALVDEDELAEGRAALAHDDAGLLALDRQPGRVELSSGGPRTGGCVLEHDVLCRVPVAVEITLQRLQAQLAAAHREPRPVRPQDGPARGIERGSVELVDAAGVHIQRGIANRRSTGRSRQRTQQKHQQHQRCPQGPHRPSTFSPCSVLQQDGVSYHPSAAYVAPLA